MFSRTNLSHIYQDGGQTPEPQDLSILIPVWNSPRKKTGLATLFSLSNEFLGTIFLNVKNMQHVLNVKTKADPYKTQSELIENHYSCENNRNRQVGWKAGLVSSKMCENWPCLLPGGRHNKAGRMHGTQLSLNLWGRRVRSFWGKLWFGGDFRQLKQAVKSSLRL